MSEHRSTGTGRADAPRGRRDRPRTTARGAALVAALLAAVPGTATAASAVTTEVACGTTLGSDTVLTADLQCPPGTALVLADGVDLDLGGYAVRGSGTGTGIDLRGSATVHDGTLTGWSIGVLHSPTTAVPQGDVVLRRVTVTDTGVGMLLHAASVRVDSPTLRRNALGLSCRTPCTVRGGTFTDHTGVALQSSGGLDVADSTFRNNNAGVSLLRAQVPSTVRASSFYDNTVGLHAEHSRVTVVDNVLRRNATGISTSDAATAQPFVGDHELRGNVLTGNGDGIVSTSTAIRLRANVALRNTGWGIHAPSATNLGGNVAAGNGRSPQCVCGS